MVVGARNPEGVSCAQRPSCRASQPFGFHDTIELVYYLLSWCGVLFVSAVMEKNDGKRAA
jgi:hypothetical protein